jgi:pimeloyl-ACP methyl ester carboxylesterase
MSFLRTINPQGHQRLVCFSPMGASPSLWDHVLGLMDQSWEIVHVNYPGYGTQKYQPFDSIDSFAVEIANEMNALEVKPTHLLGYSFGSWVTQYVMEYLTTEPCSLVLIGSSEKIYQQGISLLNSWLDISLTEGIEAVLRQVSLWSFYTKTFEQVPSLVRTFTDASLKAIQTPEAIIGQIRMSLACTKTLDLERFSGPVLIIRGEYDNFYPRFCSENLLRRFRNAELIEFPDSGHAVLSESAFGCSKSIRKFFAKHATLNPIQQ